jgi:hypothetical protein
MNILVNDKVERDFQLVPNSTIDIAARTSAAVTKTQIRSLLYQTYDFARRNNFGFHVTYIDKDLPSPTSFGPWTRCRSARCCDSSRHPGRSIRIQFQQMFATRFQIKLHLQPWARFDRAPRTTRSLNLSLIRRGSRRVEQLTRRSG